MSINIFFISAANGLPPSSYKISNSQYSRQLMEAGMPEIPEFPFKDPSSLPPLLSSNTPSEYLNCSSLNTCHKLQQFTVNFSFNIIVYRLWSNWL